MRDMQRGGCLTAIFNLFMFRIIRLVIGLVLIFIVLAICVVVALVAS